MLVIQHWSSVINGCHWYIRAPLCYTKGPTWVFMQTNQNANAQQRDVQMCCVYLRDRCMWELCSDADPTKEMIHHQWEAGASDDKPQIWQLTYSIVDMHHIKLHDEWDYSIFKADLPKILVHRFEEEFVAVDRPVTEDIFKIRQSYLVWRHWQFHQIRSLLLVYMVNDFRLRHENMSRTIAGEHPDKRPINNNTERTDAILTQSCNHDKGCELSAVLTLSIRTLPLWRPDRWVYRRPLCGGFAACNRNRKERFVSFRESAVNFQTISLPSAAIMWRKDVIC